jgi:methylenetetrahydrofolate dehydrogenase (NADP+)/methenyltetrahydrofolate cyclohydrolase
MHDTHVFTGFEIAERIHKQLKTRVDALGRSPRCFVLLDEDNAGAAAYAVRLQETAAAVGIEILAAPYAKDSQTLCRQLEDARHENAIDAVIPLYPLPPIIDQDQVARLIGADKDVDGLHPLNAGLLALGAGVSRAAATGKACVLVLEEVFGSLRGLDVAVVGASIIVGRPLALMLMDQLATVTVCHEATRDLATHTAKADAIISATGVPGLIKAQHIRQGSVLIDVGITRTKHGLVGDVDLASVAGKASLVTHVPDGVGPVTTACLLENILAAAEAA